MQSSFCNQKSKVEAGERTQAQTLKHMSSSRSFSAGTNETSTDWQTDLHVLPTESSSFEQSFKPTHPDFRPSRLMLISDASPELLYWFSEQTLQPGPTVSLKCVATGNPLPQFTWSLDGFPVSLAAKLLLSLRRKCRQYFRFRQASADS